MPLPHIPQTNFAGCIVGLALPFVNWELERRPQMKGLDNDRVNYCHFDRPTTGFRYAMNGPFKIATENAAWHTHQPKAWGTSSLDFQVKIVYLIQENVSRPARSE